MWGEQENTDSSGSSPKARHSNAQMPRCSERKMQKHPESVGK